MGEINTSIQWELRTVFTTESTRGFNKRSLLPHGFRLTNNVAELYTPLVGLEFGDFIQAEGIFHETNDVYEHPREQDTLRGIKRVVIDHHVRLLVREMAEYISEWKDNGWKAYNGGAVATKSCSSNAYLESCGIEVRSRLVSREHNRGADPLARSIRMCLRKHII